MADYSYQSLPFRNILASTFQRYKTLFKVDQEGKAVSIGFPYAGGSTKVRPLDKKSFYWAGEHKPGLFGYDRFEAGTHRYVCITEGELDALSVFQTTGVPSVSVQSASSAVSDCTACRSWLDSFERIYLAFDNDARGREALRQVANLFDYSKLYHVKFYKYKDANDYLQAGEGEDLRSLFFASRKYLPETIISSFADFKEILLGEQKPSVHYPWPTLSELTGGIRRAESVLLTAQEGVGKTELMHAILYHLLKETDDVCGAIFLEEPKRRLLQALAGLECQSRLYLPDQARPMDEQVSLLEKAVGNDGRLLVYSHFGSDDPEVLLDTIRFMVTACNGVYILLDHVSMVVSGLAGEDERRALDYIATRLEMMVKELNFSLIMVSHVNDEGKTRGSRYLSKISDIRIDLTRDLMASDPVIANTTLLTVSKNRFSGRTGHAGDLFFDSKTGVYHERCGNQEGTNVEYPVLSERESKESTTTDF